MKRNLFLIVLLLFVCFSCKQEEPEPLPIAVEAVELNKTSLTLKCGESAVLVATIHPDDAENQGLSWYSTDDAIVTVNNGKVTAISAGEASIIVETDDGGYAAECMVTVTDENKLPEEGEEDPIGPSWGICGTFNDWGQNGHKDVVMLDTSYENYYVSTDVSLTNNSEFKFRYDNKWDENYGLATKISSVSTNTKYTLSQGGENILMVNGGTYDIFLSKSFGHCYIMTKGSKPQDAVKPGEQAGPSWGICGTINNWGQDGDKDIVMTQSSNENYYVATSVSLTSSDEFKFRYNNDWGKNYGGEDKYSTFSPNTKYSTVSDGKNIKVADSGTYDIYLSKSYDTFYIMDENKVPEDAESSDVAVTGITLNQTSVTLTKGESVMLIATVAPSEATDKSVTWTSSNISVATVTDGEVKAISEGETVVTVKTKDGRYTATCKVVVTSGSDSGDDYGPNARITMKIRSDMSSYVNAEYYESYFKDYPPIGFGANYKGVKYLDGELTVYFDGDITSIPGNDTSNNTLPFGLSESISLPNTITQIGSSVFKGVSGTLKSVNLPTALQVVGEYAFANLSCISNVDLKELRQIGKGAFQNCSNLYTVTFSNTLTSIGDFSFYGTSIRELNIPSSVENIGTWAFNSCSSLTSLTIGNNSKMTTCVIGDGAFDNCVALSSVTLGSEVKNIALNDCPSISNILLKDGLESIFVEGGIPIKSLTIPGTVKDVSGFQDCKELETLTIGDNNPLHTTVIGDFAFNNCTSLKETVLYASVKTWKDGSFDHCTGKLIVNCEGKINLGQTVFESMAHSWCNFDTVIIGENVEEIVGMCLSVKEVKFSNNSRLTTIGNFAFEGCNKLTGIELPNSVTKIGIEAFDRAFAEGAEIVIPSSVTEIGGNAFNTYETMNGILEQKNLSVKIYCDLSDKNNSEISGYYKSIYINGDYDKIHEDVSLMLLSEGVLEVDGSIKHLGGVIFGEELKEVRLSKSIENIGGFRANSIEIIYSEATNPPTCESSLLGIANEIGSIFVPKQSVDLYKSADGWKMHADKIIGYDFN